MGGGQIRKDLDGNDIIGYGKSWLYESMLKYFSILVSLQKSDIIAFSRKTYF